MLTLFIVGLLTAYGGWRGGRAYQKWRSGSGWKKQLKD